MNEYIICYTLDNDIIREKIVKGLDFKKEDVMKEVIKKINENKYLIVKSNMGEYKIKSSLIRYIQVCASMIKKNNGIEIELTIRLMVRNKENPVICTMELEKEFQDGIEMVSSFSYEKISGWGKIVLKFP